MGSKGSNTTTTAQNQSQTYSANPLVAGAGQQALGMAQGAANQPFQAPIAPVAGFNADQQGAFQQFRDLQGSGQPYMNQAAHFYSPQGAQDFYNPMAASVMANMQDVFGQQLSQNQGALTQKAGGVGADRIAVGQANLAKQQDLSAGQTMSNLYQQAVQQAQQAGQGYAGLGNQTFNQNLQSAGALAGAGQTQQQQAQSELNAPYQNQLARLAYPFQTAQYLAGITGGLAPTFGGTTIGNMNSQTTKPAPSLLSQLVGAGTAGAGLYGSFGGFGGGNEAYGGSGKGSASNGVYGGSSANPLDGLSASDYGAGFARGGSPTSGNIDKWREAYFAEGGAAEEEDNPSVVNSEPAALSDSSIVPKVHMPSGGGHSGPTTGAMQFSQPPQQSESKDSNPIGDIVSMASKVLPFFLKKGGAVPGFDEGGSTFDDRFGAAFQGAKPDSFSSRFGGYPATQAVAPGDINKLMTPHEQAMDAFRMASTTPTRIYGKTNPDEELPDAAEPTVGNLRSRPSDPVKDYMAPQDQMPYPDATERDWGQNATRSPWMNLVHAGAAMMSTPGSFGEALGAGLKAGATNADTQRKELRSEEEINNKARTLYQSAKQHLDQYTKMTPYQRESLRLKNKELDQEDNKKITDFKPAEITAAIKAVKDDPMNIGKTQDELKVLVAKELAMRKALRGNGEAVSAPAADGSSSSTALPDPGAAGRIKGRWYIGPSGQPQQWLGG